MNEPFKLIRIKRNWVPEWLFAALATPVDFIAPKWLPFRYCLTKDVGEFMLFTVKVAPLSPNQKEITCEIEVPITRCPHNGEALLTSEAIERIDQKRISMILNQLQETIRELTGYYK